MKATLLATFRLNLSRACDSSTFPSSRLVGNQSATHSPVNKDRKLDKTLAGIGMAISLAGAAHAATVMFSPSNSPPLGGAIIISNLIGAPPSPDHGTDYGPSSNVDDPKYVANDQPVQGQTFATGTNASGYKLTAASLRHVSYTTFLLVPGLNSTIPITRPLSA